MLSFKRPAGSDKSGGHKLPMPLRSLDKMDVGLRRSELSMIAGIPGSGKSSLALHFAVKCRVPTLYVAADTSEWTMRVRTLAMLSGSTQAQCEQALLDEPQVPWFTDVDHIAWCFDAAPTVSSIRLEVDAYVEVHGVAPELIVVDNLIDVASHAGDEWQALRATMKDLKVLARDTDSAVLVLHHTSEDRNIKVMHAPPRSAIQGKVAQLPALVLTVDNGGNLGSMAVGVVKNRYGMANANGSYGPALEFDPSRMLISDKVVRF